MLMYLALTGMGLVLSFFVWPGSGGPFVLAMDDLETPALRMLADDQPHIKLLPLSDTSHHTPSPLQRNQPNER